MLDTASARKRNEVHESLGVALNRSVGDLNSARALAEDLVSDLIEAALENDESALMDIKMQAQALIDYVGCSRCGWKSTARGIDSLFEDLKGSLGGS